MLKRTIATLATLLCLFLPATALAATDPLSAACGASQDASTSAVCDKHTDPIVGSNGVLKKVSLIIATIAGIIAVIVIIIAGLQYVLSNGDAQKAANARSALIGAAVGLVIITASESILLFVVSRL